MNLGMDFGSTYTILSTYRTGQQAKIEALEVDSSSGNINIPTVVSVQKNNIRYGSLAKDKTGKRHVKTYKAFKMLLMEANKELIQKRNYTEDYSPRWATEMFMRSVIEKVNMDEKTSEIENLVIGAPDVWFHSFDSLSGRVMLRDICKEIEGVQNVQIISEPVLASAFFAYNFMNKRNKPYEGNILIIDYGGGTLDLSLTNVSKGKDTAMEIKSLYSNGAGENTDRTIGNAGIVYMESLMEYVIRKNTPDIADELIGTEDFYRAVNSLEKELKAETANIERTFEENEPYYLDELEDEIMGDSIECGDEYYDITFADMLVVYREKIEKVFEEKMDDMIRWASSNDIDMDKAGSDKFRIALVGGFGNFYLVKKQMRDKFQFTEMDFREKDIIEARTDRERAISYGAALIASNIVGICNTAPYSIGISYEQSGKEIINYMAHYKDEIQLEHPYYLKDASGDYQVLILGQNSLSDFVIDYGDMSVPRIDLTAKDEFKNKLSNLIKNELRTCCIGISFGRSDILNLHIREYDFFNQKVEEEEQILELGQLKDIFYQKGHK